MSSSPLTLPYKENETNQRGMTELRENLDDTYLAMEREKQKRKQRLLSAQTPVVLEEKTPKVQDKQVSENVIEQDVEVTGTPASPQPVSSGWMKYLKWPLGLGTTIAF